jgi:uncharacterized protein YbaP (TraB family)
MIVKSLCWQIIKKDHTSFLIGTMHLNDASLLPFIDTVCQKFSQIDAYYGEINLNKANEFNTSLSNQQYEWSYKRSLSKNRYIKVRRIIKQVFSIDLDLLDNIPPLMLHQYITDTLIKEKIPFTMDQEIWNRAQNFGLQMGGIETIEEQFDIFHDLGSHNGKYDLKKITSNPSKFKASLQQLMQYYFDQDIHALYKTSRKSLGKHRKVMINQRNGIMASRLEEIMSKSSVMTCVGAAHLSGKFGLLKLLKSKGFIVEADPLKL